MSNCFLLKLSNIDLCPLSTHKITAKSFFVMTTLRRRRVPAASISTHLNFHRGTDVAGECEGERGLERLSSRRRSLQLESRARMGTTTDREIASPIITQRKRKASVGCIISIMVGHRWGSSSSSSSSSSSIMLELVKEERKRREVRGMRDVFESWDGDDGDTEKLKVMAHHDIG
ncbi:hypothetical protein MUK42_03151 [Musa troglodytarum]|uniref:Uncharacterized protein n=1 Tax=Musa troglodytarum TaxID=320322 RepID=A0A9E7HA16_9LILI|nr:hypothetical protein MUK42_03151 [Musa troglodytarum]URE26305.1 hypothetical protein MUK42_03151 [Musa troglodytarum]